MRAYLLDTNIVTAVLKRNPDVTARLRSALAVDSRVLVSAVVCCQIARGLRWRDASGQLVAFRQFVDSLEWLDVSSRHWDTAAQLWARCRRLGAALDDADLVLAAQVMDTQAMLVSDDKDFDLIDISRENWISRSDQSVKS